MKVIVDAWNVLHIQGVLPPGLAGLSLSGLGRLMQATRWQAAHAVLVCDGRPQPRPQGLPEPIHVMWSGPGREADDLIEDMIGKAADPRRVLVVSTDRRLRKAAKRRRCKWLDSESFLRTMLEDIARGTAPDQPAPPAADDWTSEFALSDGELDAIAAEAEAADLDAFLPDDGHPRAESSPSPGGQDAGQDAGLDPPQDTPKTHFPAEVLEQARRIAGDV
ncbi:MAG: NYN domain-containing protein [Phycisphaerales bacterium]|jgi:hypothetical protein|nr:NYN domain-containing protein [Phycisphaerales bacterium]